MGDMERLPISNLQDESVLDRLFSQIQALARATRIRANLPGPAESPSREEIELRAYEIFQERGSLHGHDAEDWLEAERQLLLEKS